MLGVSAGAFGAHLLKKILDPTALAWWQTAVDYQMWTGLGVFALGLTSDERGHPIWKRRGALCLLWGVLIFSGSLYCMALTGQRWLGAVTPIGGIGLILGWMALILAFGRPAESHRTPEKEPTSTESPIP